MNSSATPLDNAIADWRATLGAARVLTGPDLPAHHQTDTSSCPSRPSAVLKVATSGQVPEVLAIARLHRIPVHPISTGNNWGYGSALPNTPGAAILDLSDLKGIIHFDPLLGVVTVEPGVTQGMLADFLDRTGHDHMVPVTGAGPHCSLLANALERGYGITPHSDHFGAVTDVEAILADGTLYRSALSESGTEELARLFKWGIGPYINGLFTQSGFGVVTKVSIALARKPECTKICLFNLPEDDLLETAVDKVRELLSELPGILGGVNLMNRHRVLAMTAPYPDPEALDSRGLMPNALVASMGRQYQVAPWTGFATLYGTRAVVQAAQRHIRRKLQGTATRLLFLEPRHVHWIAKAAQLLPGKLGGRLRRTVNTLKASMQLVQGRPNETALPITYWRSRTSQPDTNRDPARDHCGLLWYAPLVPMRAQTVRDFVTFAAEILTKNNLEPLITLTSQGDRLFDSTIPLLFDRQNDDAATAASKTLEELIARGRGIGAYPYRLHLQSQDLHLARQPNSSEIITRLKRALDPDDILAPGRYTKRHQPANSDPTPFAERPSGESTG